MSLKPRRLNARLIEAFQGVFLSPMLDDPKPTPQFHREVWELYCSESSAVGVAAPRGHAKSTALTHTFGLANALFRIENHILVVSATEELSMGHLGDMSRELRDNDDLRQEFGIIGFDTDAKGEIVAKCDDGYSFRILARGAGQKLRGLKWNGRRPGLILCDDMEEDEQVMSLDRRVKFRQWVLRALMPLGRRGAKIRWHGTILHEDAMLARIMKDPTWDHKLYRAHNSYDDFSHILWPEQFSEDDLRLIQRRYVAQKDYAGYAQEYLNDPRDSHEAYLQSAWFIPMAERDHHSPKIIGVAADFAITKKDYGNRTSFTVGGKDESNLLHIVDQFVGRWDSLEIVERIFDIQEKWDPAFFWVEKGQIWNALYPHIQKEMHKRQIYINFLPRTPIGDKPARGRSLQKRMRAEAVKFDVEAPWYPGYEDELLHFTGFSDAVLDDQFDSTALLSLGFDDVAEVEKEDFFTDEEIEIQRGDPRRDLGRSEVTGY